MLIKAIDIAISDIIFVKYQRHHGKTTQLQRLSCPNIIYIWWGFGFTILHITKHSAVGTNRSSWYAFIHYNIEGIYSILD